MTEEQSGEFASHGVEELIDRLRNEGVEAGEQQAELIIQQAQKEAEQIKAHAAAEADFIKNNAKMEADALIKAGQDALQLAARDAHLKLRETIMQRFSDEVRRLVGKIMEPEAFMEKLILQVAARVSDQTDLPAQENFILKLPEGVIGIEELRRNPEDLSEGTLSHFVLSVMANLLRDGIELKTDKQFERGIKIYLKQGDVEVDLTDQAIAAVLLEHLQPRFRALLEGIVK